MSKAALSFLKRVNAFLGFGWRGRGALYVGYAGWEGARSHYWRQHSHLGY